MYEYSTFFQYYKIEKRYTVRIIRVSTHQLIGEFRFVFGTTNVKGKSQFINRLLNVCLNNFSCARYYYIHLCQRYRLTISLVNYNGYFQVCCDTISMQNNSFSSWFRIFFFFVLFSFVKFQIDSTMILNYVCVFVIFFHFFFLNSLSVWAY